MAKKNRIIVNESASKDVKTEMQRKLNGEPEIVPKPREGYYFRKSSSQPWKMIECKKPDKHPVTSKVTQAQNLHLGDASKLAKEQLADPALSAAWDAQFQIDRRNRTKHGKPLQTLRQFVISRLMSS